MSDLSRSPLLLDPSTSALLVVDVQEKLLPLVQCSSAVLANVTLLMDAANRFEIPVVATEQYPAGLGPSVATVAERLSGTGAREKRMFSCRECQEVFAEWHAHRRRQVVVVGIEAHVCVLQTVLDLLAMGFDCYVVVDATGSRNEVDQKIAWQRMEISGAILTTTESALFEWCEDSRHPQFKQISAWVKARERSSVPKRVRPSPGQA
jgi:nicotinamidase-related amidase